MFAVSIRFAVVALLALVVSGGAASSQSPQAPSDTDVTALTGVRIIDGTGRPAIEQGTIVFTNGRITAAGRSSVQVPAGATRVDLAGKTVMPGMINAHAHVQHQTQGDAHARRSGPAAADVRLLRRHDRRQPRPDDDRGAGRGHQAARRAGSGPARSGAGLHLRPEHPQPEDARRGAPDRQSLRRPEGRSHQDARRQQHDARGVRRAHRPGARTRTARGRAHLLPEGSGDGAGTGRGRHCPQRPRPGRHPGLHRRA